MADSVYQFGALKVLDEFFGTTDDGERDRRYDLAIERLQRDDFDLLGDTVAGIERAHLAHLDEHWLPDRGAGYWQAIGTSTVNEALQQGFLAAIRDAKQERKPLVSVWVCATEDSDADDFRVEHVVGPTTVIVAIISPRPKR